MRPQSLVLVFIRVFRAFILSYMHCSGSRNVSCQWSFTERDTFARLVDIQQRLWLHDTSTAYVMSEWDTGLLRMPRQRYANGEPIFHVARKVIATRGIGFMNVPWFLVQRIDALIEHFHESGILQRYHELSTFVFELRQGKGSSSAREMFDDSYDFLWYWHAAALGVALAVFGAELLVFRVCTGMR